MNEPLLLPFVHPDEPRAASGPNPDPVAALVEQERTILVLRGEVAARQYLLEREQKQTASALADIAHRETIEQALRAEIARREVVEQALRAEIAERQRAELALTASAGWRVVQILRRWRVAVAPPASWRERVFLLLKRAMRVWRREGLYALADRMARKTYRKGLQAAKRWRSISRPQEDQKIERPSAGASDLLAMHLTPELWPAAGMAPTPAPATSAIPLSQVRTIPALAEILSLSASDAVTLDRPVDVIVLGSRGLDATLGCLHSLLTARTAIAYEIFVVRGAELDFLLTHCLREIAAAGLITLLEDSPTGGSEEVVRRALALHPARDVVLLDAGVAVYGDWVDRLRKIAYIAKDVGTVAPFTNAATLCSYPFFDPDSPFFSDCRLPDDLLPEHLDHLCATVNRGEYVELPIGTGPCLYIRRDCLAAVCPMSHQPEAPAEDDSTLRSRFRLVCGPARDHGWRHLGAADIFVYQHEAAACCPDSLSSLLDGPPAGDPLIESYRIANPGLPYRRQIDLARLTGPRPGMLFISHQRGGGTERHIGDMARRLEDEGVRVIILRPAGEGRVRLERLGETTTPNLVFTLPDEYWTLREALLTLDIGHVHIHHTLDVPAAVLDLIGDLGLAYDWTVHDYYPICPRVNLLDERGVYCGEPGPARCNVCLEKNEHFGGDQVEILSWRAEHRARLARARKVFVPHEDVAARLTRYFPDVAFTVRPHFETWSAVRPVVVPLAAGEPLRVALIGHLCVHKGAAILVDCTRDALARRLPIQFAVVGHTDRDFLLRELSNVTITGPYREEEILELLESLRCHCAFFPWVWPETFSYTLSIAFQAGLFPVAFDLGAPAGRIRASGTGRLIPLTTDAATINQALLSLTPHLAQAPADLAVESGHYPNLLADYYELAKLESAAA